MSALTKSLRLLGLVLGVVLASFVVARQKNAATSYTQLLTLFTDWRAFQQPSLANGVPDYSVAAMQAQLQNLAAYRQRLAAIDTAGWSISQQVDWYIVRAEMNGLDFDHRVLRPWANNPAFYATVFWDQSDQPAREGPHSAGMLELWRTKFPLSKSEEKRIDSLLALIPNLLAQAQNTLVGNGKDLWNYGIVGVREQKEALTQLAARTATESAKLKSRVTEAQRATDRFIQWLEQQSPSKTGPSGVGVENYNWYLKNVQLVPYTWAEEVALMERELARANTALALEEEKNKNLPLQSVVSSAEEHASRFGAAITEYMKFLSERNILTVKSYMGSALRVKIGKFSRGPLEFFSEVDYRDPMVMRTHGYHWFDLAQMENEPHADPIRRGPLLYNIFNTRTEGHATAWEELMMQAGMFAAHPRTDELIYILLAERAARALGELRMVSGEFTLEQAAVFTSRNTPRNWLRLDGNLVRGEQHLYLQQPGYGPSYLVGKIQIEHLIGERKIQLGDRFQMKEFMDSYNAAGLIPASLLRWELTGEMPDDVKRMLDSL
jgi:hypothetical protein